MNCKKKPKKKIELLDNPKKRFGLVEIAEFKTNSENGVFGERLPYLSPEISFIYLKTQMCIAASLNKAADNHIVEDWDFNHNVDEWNNQEFDLN